MVGAWGDRGLRGLKDVFSLFTAHVSYGACNIICKKARISYHSCQMLRYYILQSLGMSGVLAETLAETYKIKIL